MGSSRASRPCPTVAMLEHVNVPVCAAAEGDEEVGHGAGELHPGWHLGLVRIIT